MQATDVVVAPPIAPSPPQRRHGQQQTRPDSVVFNLDTLLAQRAQRMIAAGTHRQFEDAVGIKQSLKPSAPPPSDGKAVVVAPRHHQPRDRDASSRYPLQWDPRAIPLLCFAESEARQSAIGQEREYRVALMASIHSVMVQAFYTCALEKLEHDTERHYRSVVCSLERKGRALLWEAHEELIITEQLRELDIPEEEAVHFLHRASVCAHSEGSTSGPTALTTSAAAATAARKRHLQSREGTSPVSEEGTTEVVEKTSREPDWILGIAYLITFDLSMEERKIRLQVLRKEFNRRNEVRAAFTAEYQTVLQSVQDRRHAERCDAYRQARWKAVSNEMLFEHLSASLWEDWMHITMSIMAVAIGDAHKRYLRHMHTRWRRIEWRHSLKVVSTKETWHRTETLTNEYARCTLLMLEDHYVRQLDCIAAEEARVWDESFVPWMRSAPALVRSTQRRLRAALVVQIAWRKVCHGLKGWRATHKRIGGEIRSMRTAARRERDKTSSLGHAMALRLKALMDLDTPASGETL